MFYGAKILMVPGHLVLRVTPESSLSLVLRKCLDFRDWKLGVLIDCSQPSTLPLLSRGKEYGSAYKGWRAKETDIYFVCLQELLVLLSFSTIYRVVK